MATVRRGTDLLAGDRITFWTHDDRIICEPGRLKIRLGGGPDALKSIDKGKDGL